MKKLLALLTMAAVSLGLVLGACKTPPTTAPTPAVVYSELVEAGCLQADNTGLAAVTAGMASDAGPAWFTCLAGGGTVAGCSVPCDAAAGQIKR